MRPVYFLPAAALVVASLVPLAAYATTLNPDAPTQAAITALRTKAAALVDSMPNNKGVSGSQVTASYDDQLKDQSSQRMNTVMIVKTRAEQAAWSAMDPTSRALVKNFFAAGL